MLLLLTIYAATDGGSSSQIAADISLVIGAIAGLLLAIATLIGAAHTLRRRRNQAEEEPAAEDPPPVEPGWTAIRREIDALERALETSDEERDDLRAQLRDCRLERDRHLVDVKLSLTHIGDLERQLADLRQRERDTS